jgi:hypothetical protein
MALLADASQHNESKLSDVRARPALAHPQGRGADLTGNGAKLTVVLKFLNHSK